MKRHEMIRLQYRARRYMEHLSDQELENRAKDILLNQFILTEENKIGPHPINEEGEYWMTVFTHLLEEYVIRFGPYPAGFPRGLINQVRIPDPRLAAASKACEVVKMLKTKPGKYFSNTDSFHFWNNCTKTAGSVSHLRVRMQTYP